MRSLSFWGGACPECLAVAQQVAAIPSKRVPPPETRFLDRDEIETLFHQLPADGRFALRDRALLLLLYNSGGRVQEVADLRVEHLELGAQPRVRLHGKGDKWRICPLWEQTARLLKQLVSDAPSSASPARPVFASQSGRALTRFGIYKIVRRHTGDCARHRPALNATTSARTSFDIRVPSSCSRPASMSM